MDGFVRVVCSNKLVMSIRRIGLALSGGKMLIHMAIRVQLYES